MKAAWYERNGPAARVLEVGDMPAPKPGPGEVRVRVHASGVNPSDVKGRNGREPIAPRIIPHSDGAGEIDLVGDGVNHARIGERVWIWNGQWRRPFGTAAEYIVLPEDQAVTLHKQADFAAGACFGIPALTASHAVNLHGEIGGKTLLITGAGSSVGYYAVQFAKSKGARVIGTASGARADLARQAGADFVIDYKVKDVTKVVKDLTGGKGAHGIIDMDFSSTASLIANGVVAPHGKTVCYGSNTHGDVQVSFPTMLWNSLSLQVFLVYELLPQERKAAIEQLNREIAGGRLKHAIGKRFRLDEIVDAHEAVESGDTVGNVVIDII